MQTSIHVGDLLPRLRAEDVGRGEFAEAEGEGEGEAGDDTNSACRKIPHR